MYVTVLGRIAGVDTSQYATSRLMMWRSAMVCALCGMGGGKGITQVQAKTLSRRMKLLQRTDGDNDSEVF
jgi:hypothetical protein